MGRKRASPNDNPATPPPNTPPAPPDPPALPAGYRAWRDLHIGATATRAMLVLAETVATEEPGYAAQTEADTPMPDGMVAPRVGGGIGYVVRRRPDPVEAGPRCRVIESELRRIYSCALREAEQTSLAGAQAEQRLRALLQTTIAIMLWWRDAPQLSDEQRRQRERVGQSNTAPISDYLNEHTGQMWEAWAAVESIAILLEQTAPHTVPTDPRPALTKEEHRILWELHKTDPVSATLSDLEGRTPYTRKSCGTYVKSLKAHGLVKSNRSRKGVNITPAGETLLESTPPPKDNR